MKAESNESNRSGNGGRSRMRTAVSWTVTVLLVGLVVGVIGYGVTREPSPVETPAVKLANVEVQTVRAKTYEETLNLPATLLADKEGTVSSEIGGRLERWAVAEGAWVERGGVVAVLDTSSLEASRAEIAARLGSARVAVKRAERGVEAARLASAAARTEVEARNLRVKAAESGRTLAETEYTRVKNLVEQGVLDRARLDAARDARTQAGLGVEQAGKALEAAQVQVEAAGVGEAEAEAARELAGAGVKELEAALASVGVEIDKATLRTPVSGVLEEHLVEPGEVVGAAQVLARLYDLRHLRAVVHVPDRFVAFLDPDNPAAAAFIERVRPGARHEVTARVEIPGLPKLTGGSRGGVDLPARVARVAQASDPESNTFEVELRFENPGGVLRQGVIGRGVIEYLVYPDAVVIPARAIQATDEGPRVLVAEAEGDRTVARVRDIVPASIRDDQVLVLDGLGAGDRLIVAGWKGLVAGEVVRVVLDNGAYVAVEDEKGPRSAEGRP